MGMICYDKQTSDPLRNTQKEKNQPNDVGDHMKSRYFFITAAFLSFVLSVTIWFLFKNENQAIFVGIWVPSILCLGRYFDG